MTSVSSKWLVETEWLAARLDDASVRILECTAVNRPIEPFGYRAESGRASWAKAHIPGSGFVDLVDELCDHESRFRFMLPSAARFAAAMSALGVGDGMRVVLYDRRMNMWAARVWWMLRAFGFDDAAVLNGGWRKWRRENRPVSDEDVVIEPRSFVARSHPEGFTDKNGVLAGMRDTGCCLLNALTQEQHQGTGGVHYGRPGRIPGSVNVPAQSLVDPETHAYLPVESLRQKFADAGALEARSVITYCGGGIAASSAAFVLALLGKDDVAVYDASMSEWASDASLPMETG